MKKSLILILALLLFSVAYADNRIIVSKRAFTLWVISDANDTILTIPIACGLHLGDKTKEGDKRTPEGTFKITSIEKSDRWTFDFNDGLGKRKGAYGPWFMRLNVPNNTTIGLHGTILPHTIGTRSSAGCIRMSNEDISRLRPLVKVGTTVTILPDVIVQRHEYNDTRSIQQRLSLPGRISMSK